MIVEEVLDIIYSIKNRCTIIEFLNTLQSKSHPNLFTPTRREIKRLTDTLCRDILRDIQEIVEATE